MRPSLSRRLFLQRMSVAAAAIYAPQSFAESLLLTPRQTEGPFYPDRLPLDRDNDLVTVGDRLTPAIGEITQLFGRVVDQSGSAVKNALVEIWQVDANGVYLHSGTSGSSRRDPGFQGYGRFETASSGEYRFRTIKPVAYPGRPPHIHFKVSRGGRELLTTQCYVKGEPQNDRDGIIRSIRDPRARESVIVPFTPLAGSPGQLTARFDIVLGVTPPA